MSTAKGVARQRRGQAHQNRFPYRHNKNSKKTAHIMTLQHSGLCTRCDEKIEWRKKFRKYKPITQAKKCRACEQPTITRAYHVFCTPCAQAKSVCPICTLTRDQAAAADQYEELEGAQRATNKAIQQYLGTLRERNRRSILRQLESKKSIMYVRDDGTMFLYRIPVETEDGEDDEEAGDSGEKSDQEKTDEGAGTCVENAGGESEPERPSDADGKHVHFEDTATATATAATETSTTDATMESPAVATEETVNEKTAPLASPAAAPTPAAAPATETAETSAP